MATNNTVKIKGVTGFGHFPFNERIKGRLDAKQNQVCTMESGCTTPWVLRKSWHCDNYINRAYLSAEKKLEDAHRDAYTAAQQMLELHAEEFPEEHSSLGEQDLRLAANRKGRITRNQNTISQLKLRLAEIEAKVEETDADLTHTIECAEATLHAHILPYWEGVLRSSAAGALPVVPAMRTKEPAGRDSYLKKRTYLLSIIQQATGNDHVNDDTNHMEV